MDVIPDIHTETAANKWNHRTPLVRMVTLNYATCGLKYISEMQNPFSHILNKTSDVNPVN